MESECVEPRAISGSTRRDALVVENERLRARAHAASREAAHWEAQAREAARTKHEMLDILGDELRNPLAAMVLSLGRLQQHNQSNQGDDRLCQTLARQVDRLGALVTELIEASRACNGRVYVDRRRAELRTVIDAALADVASGGAPPREDISVDVDVDVPAAGLAVLADRSLLRQALVEVLRNAIRFAPAGRPLHIAIDAVVDRGDALICVADDGAGVSPDKLDAIFEPFVQGFPLQTRAVRGLGLGLTIVRRLVQLHGGTVRASSAGPGCGFEIEIRLPLAPFISASGGPDEK